MRIKVFGYRGRINSTERIEQELVRLGCVLDDTSPEWIIDLNGPFNESEAFFNQSGKRSKRLYCLLDVDTAKPIAWYHECAEALKRCDIACAISGVVANQIKHVLKVDRKIHILPHPIRNITRKISPKGIPFLWSGRCSGWNKNFILAMETLDTLNVGRDSLVIAGTENPFNLPFFINSPSDEELNVIFNSSEFLLSPSEFEGQNCNMLQAVISHTYPILNRNCEVVREFGLEAFSANPDPIAMGKKINEIKTMPNYYDSILNELRPEFENKFKVESIAKQILDYCKASN